MEHTVSWKTIFRVLTTVLAVYLSFRLVNIILVILTSIMLAAAFHPIVTRLKRYMPNTLAAAIVILLLLSPIVLIAFAVLPNLIDQFPQILATVSTILNKTTVLPPALRNVDLTQYASNVGSYLLRSTSIITNAVTTFFTTIFLTLYLLVDSERLTKLMTDSIPDGQEHKFQAFIARVSQINGQYIRGNLLISVICGILIFLGLTILNIPFAASLALFAALTDLLPLIGAFIGAAPAVIIGFSISPTIGILVIGLFLIYQQFENNILAPNIYTRALDISPALSFISVLVGGALFGMFGAFIALPIAASIPSAIRFVRDYNVRL